MTPELHSVITATGSCIPSRCVRNQDFLEERLFDAETRVLRA